MRRGPHSAVPLGPKVTMSATPPMMTHSAMGVSLPMGSLFIQ
jgi:hypothetical protein